MVSDTNKERQRQHNATLRWTTFNMTTTTTHSEVEQSTVRRAFTTLLQLWAHAGATQRPADIRHQQYDDVRDNAASYK
jgi:hypothetical protein